VVGFNFFFIYLFQHNQNKIVKMKKFLILYLLGTICMSATIIKNEKSIAAENFFSIEKENVLDFKSELVLSIEKNEINLISKEIYKNDNLFIKAKSISPTGRLFNFKELHYNDATFIINYNKNFEHKKNTNFENKTYREYYKLPSIFFKNSAAENHKIKVIPDLNFIN